MLDSTPLLEQTDFPPIRRKKLTTLQVNLGYLCNLSCTHCHVNAGPKRTELASLETVEHILDFIKINNISILDVTGGAPEMNPHFKHLVKQARALDVEVIDRCNLTILEEPGYEDMAQFLADNGVTVTASLPCYQEKNVSEQRGKGVFDSSITVLQKLNRLGYGIDADKKLSLVYNPNGAFLPPDQMGLEKAYKKELKENFDIDFNELFTITNMPISRYGSMLMSKNIFDDYMGLLKSSYAPDNLNGVMCMNLLSIDWQGFVYDCDFNQMLDWPLISPDGNHGQYDADGGKAANDSGLNILASDKKRIHISELMTTNLEENPIVIGEHCYGCTAGQGSSCGGALS